MNKGRNNGSGIVFSSEHGRMCPSCNRAVPKCICSSKSPLINKDGIVRVSRETKGRKGKGVTLVVGLPLNTNDLKALAKQLKQKCGSGGTLKKGVIEIQGDHRDVVITELKGRGFTVKKAGG